MKRQAYGELFDIVPLGDDTVVAPYLLIQNLWFQLSTVYLSQKKKNLENYRNKWSVHKLFFHFEHREPVVWHLCNLAASQKRPYCASVNSHSPVGLVSQH
jgi:predicted deacetylase